LKLEGFGFVFIADFDARGKLVMDLRDLIRVMTFVATEMVKRDSFEEVDVSTLKDGVIGI